MADHRPQSISQRQALVCHDCPPPGGAARLSCAQEGAGNPDAVRPPAGAPPDARRDVSNCTPWGALGLHGPAGHVLMLASAGRLAIWEEAMGVRRAVSSVGRAPALHAG